MILLALRLNTNLLGINCRSPVIILSSISTSGTRITMAKIGVGSNGVAYIKQSSDQVAIVKHTVMGQLSRSLQEMANTLESGIDVGQ